ncbi:MAG TPA: hypothetical protein VM260_03405, partial [Pirellula sp.]|nr:hypothetical protein [Pirellula sp.]
MISAVAFLVALAAVKPTTAAEIGVPLSDPKFAIDAFAHHATKQKQGSFDVYTLTGGCRIYQGSFSATCDKAHIWIDRSLPDSLAEGHPKKAIVQTLGNCEVRWSNEQRVQDEEWMGRLFSNFD